MSMAVERFRADRIGPPPLPEEQKRKPVDEQGKVSFAEHLSRECDELGLRTKFSIHAQSRIVSRDIDLKPEQLLRIDKAVDSVTEKGASRALVMLDDIALIVGVKSRTVITLVDSAALKDNVFTSIDAAVLA